MTKVGQMIFEDGAKKERLIAVANMLKLNIEEKQILGMYSKEEHKEAKEAMTEEQLPQ